MAMEIHRHSVILHLLILLFNAAPVLGDVTRLSLIPYIHYDNRMTWSKAQAYCRYNHTDLVTIRNAQENEMFFNIYNSHGWMGLYREDTTSRWRWSRGAELANFTIWAPNEPDSNENCRFIYPDYLVWNGDNCNNDHTFMCYHERLILVKENKTWEDAMNYCRAMMPLDPRQPITTYNNNRFDLASLTLADQIYAGERAQNANTDEVWVGLRFLAGQWMWLEKGLVSYQNISQCSDQTYCGAIGKTGNSILMPIDCMEKRNFFCYDKRNLSRP